MASQSPAVPADVDAVAIAVDATRSKRTWPTLMSDPEFLSGIERARADIAAGRVHHIRDVQDRLKLPHR
jgi:hypothetical protein